jgi:cytochrome c oxidase cbb3-type subunit 3
MAEEYKDFRQEQDYEIDTLTNERLIKDHVYDGIRELDNDLPPWWKWLFYITVIFGVVYLIRLWGFQAPDLVQDVEYANEMKTARQNHPTKNEAIKFERLTDAASIEEGKKLYAAHCAVCHAADGGGLIGPNFTDDNWIHGNTMEALFGVVSDGVLEKGMTPFKDVISPNQRLQVISYILTLHGTTSANPKAPQGDKLDWPY